MLILALALTFLLDLVWSQPQAVQEPVLRHSLKAPFINNMIPFWDFGAGAYLNDTYVRVTPAKQSRTGFLWNNVVSTMIDWEVVIEFHVTGLRHIGGDGFAFWYVEKPELLGPVYGSADYWVGLGIFFDTFNNDGRGDAPLISALFNDGTQRFNAADDGADQAMATCTFPFRNMQDNSFAKIRYQNNVLTVQVALHRDSMNQPTYVNCLHVEDLVLGVDKYFGISAHTGDVADNHDVYTFTSKDLTPRNADLNAVRQRYHDRIQYEHHRPAHQELSHEDFQHEVLTMLNQIQEETNLLGVSQQGIESTLQGLSINAGAGQGGQVVAQLSDAQTSQLQNSADGVYMALQKIDNLRSALQTIEMKLSSQQGQGGYPQGGSGYQIPAPVAPTAAPFNPQPLISELANHISTSDSRVLNDIKNHVNDQVRKLSDTIRQTQADSAAIRGQLSAVSEDVRASGGVGVLFYALVIANTIGVVAILLLQFKGGPSDRHHKKFDL